MKTRWEYLEFEDCIDKIVYTNKIKRKDFLVKGEYKIISQEENYINGYWNAESDLFKIIKPVVIFGDHTKNLKYIDFDFVLGADGVKIFQPIDCINTKYFYYFLKSVKLKDLGYARHYRLLKEIKVPLPPIPEQKRIVKILDEAFAAIDKAKSNAEKNLQNSRELFDSYLNKVFANPEEDWIECFLNDYVKFIDYRGRTPEKTTQGMRLITAKNIKNGYLQKEPEEFVNPNIYDSWMTRGIPNKGDILFTTEAPLANVAQLDTDEKVVFAQRTIIFQPDPKFFNQSFLKYLLLSKPIKTRIIEKGTGATVKGIKAKLLKQIPIYFPQSLDKQERIVDKLNNLSDEIKKLETIYQQKLADLDELKKSILQKAFDGELTRNSG